MQYRLGLLMWSNKDWKGSFFSQQAEPKDYVIATGEQHSVRQFILWTAAELGLSLKFEGEGTDEVAVVDAIRGNDAPALAIGDVVMRIDARYFRPAEVDSLLGDPSKAKQDLGWQPQITVQQMCAEMVAHDLQNARRNRLLREHGLELPVALES